MSRQDSLYPSNILCKALRGGALTFSSNSLVSGNPARKDWRWLQVSFVFKFIYSLAIADVARYSYIPHSPKRLYLGLNIVLGSGG